MRSSDSVSALRRQVALVHIVAMAENGVIGRDGRLPWRVPSELRHFRAITIGKPLIMGRRTFASIGKPLPGRTNIVLSRDASFAASGVVVADMLERALAVARGDALRRGVDEICIIGGADVFAQTMPVADRLLVTQVHMNAEGDSRFPEIDPAVWKEISRLNHAAGPTDDASFTTIVYAKRNAAL